MNNIAQTGATKLESAATLPYVVPALLAINTFALLALDQVGGIPNWIKSVVAFFLSF